MVKMAINVKMRMSNLMCETEECWKKLKLPKKHDNLVALPTLPTLLCCVKKSKIGESCLKFCKYSDGGFREESIILAYYLRTRHQKPFLSNWKFDCLTMSERGNVFWGIWLFREFRSKSIEITASWRDAEQLEACYYTMTRQAMCWKSWNLIIKSMNHKQWPSFLTVFIKRAEKLPQKAHAEAI